VYLLYMVFAERRDELLQHCIANGIEAKVHYPIPIYRQKALAFLGIRAGAFPVTDRHAAECISFPVDQHLADAEQDYVIQTVRNFYAGRP
jgi:dTDP-4-amino-4,6-dideoxygalactose transaminase